MFTLFCLCLIEAMDSPKFVIREQATYFLAKLGEPALPYLMIGERRGKPEVSARCKRITDKWFSDNAERIVKLLIPSGWDDFPWIDSLQYLPESKAGYCEEYTAIRTMYVQAASEKVGYEGHPDYQRFRLATRYWFEKMVRDREPVADLEDLMWSLAEGHRCWCRSMGLPVPP